VIPSLSELRPYLLNPELSEADCIKAIRSLSAGFTVSRDKMGKYGDDADLVSAYTLLYLPTNWPKLSYILDQLNQLFAPILKMLTSSILVVARARIHSLGVRVSKPKV